VEDGEVYPELASNPHQVESQEDVDLLAARIGYKRSVEDGEAYPELASNPHQVESQEGV
jgi:hypothetical protein